MSYTSNKLLSIIAFSAVSAVSVNAALLAEFTFDNSGADIDERAGWQPAGGASQDSKVIIAQNNGTFSNNVGLTIAPLIDFTSPPDPFDLHIGMEAFAAADAFSGAVNPLGSNPATSGAATTQLAAIGQFSILNDRTPDGPLAPIGYQINPESIVLQGTATNLAGILLQDNAGDVTFLPVSTANGAIAPITFDLTDREPISFFGPERYTLFLVAQDFAPGKPEVGFSFLASDGDFIQFNGIVKPIPEPSTYMAGATAIMLGAFVYYRRRKAATAEKQIEA